jgi:hypothetical protein
MTRYSQIGSRVWRSVANGESLQNHLSREEIEYLDYQVLQWHRQLPEVLKYVHPSSGRVSPAPTNSYERAMSRLRIILYLRANQMRILIYRPVLHTATNISEHLNFASTVVDIAKDTITVLTHTNRTSEIYRTQQVMFNYFLVSALAVLFLAVSHAPAQFNDHCRDEFNMAIELVRNLSAGSYVTKRLWKTIKVLKQLAPKVGLHIRNDNHNGDHQHHRHHRMIDSADPHSSAAVAMAGLAGHNVDEMLLFSSSQSQPPTNGISHMENGASSDSPNVMANDLSSLFEAASSYASMMPPNGFMVTSSEAMENGNGGQFGGEDELSRIMRDLF